MKFSCMAKVFILACLIMSIAALTGCATVLVPAPRSQTDPSYPMSVIESVYLQEDTGRAFKIPYISADDEFGIQLTVANAPIVGGFFTNGSINWMPGPTVVQDVYGYYVVSTENADQIPAKPPVSAALDNISYNSNTDAYDISFEVLDSDSNPVDRYTHVYACFNDGTADLERTFIDTETSSLKNTTPDYSDIVGDASYTDDNGIVTFRMKADENVTLELYSGEKESGNLLKDEVNLNFSTMLKQLEISQGTLAPVFSLMNTSYSASVDNGVDYVTITAEAFNNAASISVNGELLGSSGTSQNIALSTGKNTISIEVSALGIGTQEYTIDVTRAKSSNANLSGLSISSGAMTPVFDSSTTTYSTIVENNIRSITITPTAEDPNAVVKINGTVVPGGQVSPPISLSVGSNAISVLVTAENGNTKIYNLTVSRASAPGRDRNRDSSGQNTSNSVPAYVITVGEKYSTPAIYDPDRGYISSEIGSDILNLASLNTNGISVVRVNTPQIPNLKGVILSLPANALSAEKHERYIAINTQIASVTLPCDMLSQQSSNMSQAVSLIISAGDASKISDPGIKSQIGDKPVIMLGLESAGRRLDWNNPNAPVTVRIPYKPTAQELADPEHITVWYIDGEGKVIEVPSGRYDPATGMVIFSTTHFSNYAVSYVQKTFGDLDSVVWAKKPIEVLASKGILKGITENEYDPQTNIRRADFLYFLVRTLGVDAKIDGNFDDISKAAYYYKEIAIAKKLGITNGTGNSKFNPDASITRQDMMVLTERALRMQKNLKGTGTASDVEKYADKSLIAAYAVDSVAHIVGEGFIAGSDDNINPLGNTTRAEAAVFLYRIYNKLLIR